MLDELSWEELVEHMEYEKIVPFAQTQATWQFASVAAAVMNAAALVRGSRKRFDIKDFLLKWTSKKATSTADARKPEHWKGMKLLAQMMTAAFNSPEPKKGRRNGRSG